MAPSRRSPKNRSFPLAPPDALIEQALAATGSATIRRRRFPAAQVVWLAIGMALLRNRPIRDVVDKLDLALGDNEPLVAPSSIAAARERLGEEPMLWLFARTAHQWVHQSADRDRWRGLALYGVDGTRLLVADTPDNVAHFGKSSGRSKSAYPMLRTVALNRIVAKTPARTLFLGEKYVAISRARQRTGRHVIAACGAKLKRLWHERRVLPHAGRV